LSRYVRFNVRYPGAIPEGETTVVRSAKLTTPSVEVGGTQRLVTGTRRIKRPDHPTETGTEPGCFLAVPRMPSRVRIGAVSMVVTSAITTNMVKSVGVKAPTV
jgi:hypothetical protein